jgi:transcriptional regulator with XRE-family HTH domain
VVLAHVATDFNHNALVTWHAESSMTLEEVAYRAEVSYSHLRRLLRPGGNPSAVMLARLAAVYGRDIRELFTSDADLAGVQ